jgi:hypothetical protein
MSVIPISYFYHMRASLILIVISCILFSCGGPVPYRAINLDTTPYYYVQLKGTMGTQHITMQLARSEPNVFRGYYTIDSIGEPIIFWGATDNQERLVLNESSDYNDERFFTGKLDSAGNYTGIWRGKGTSYHFTLHIDMKDATPLDVYYVADTMKAQSGPPDTYGTASNSLLWPTAQQDAATASFIRAAITGNQAITNPEKYAKREVDSFLQTYRVASADFDTVLQIPNTSLWAADGDMKVVWNHYPTLVLESFSYDYTGGAHGNYGTFYQVLDLKRKKVLTPADILKPGYDTAITPLLEKRYKEIFKMDPDQDLGEVLLQKHIKPNNNFLVTDKGIAFSYTPYEIGPFAMGQVTLFLPFTDIKQYVK